MKRWLDLDTEKKSSQTEYVEHLEARLRSLGVEPVPGEDLDEQHRLLASAKESALTALRVYNDPSAGFRTQTDRASANRNHWRHGVQPGSRTTQRHGIRHSDP